MVAKAAGNGGVRLIDMIFPGDTNHHGTLFGGVALAHMDKAAFPAASRHGRAPFVTASCERIDFAAPALKGELIEVTGRIVRVGISACDVDVDFNRGRRLVEYCFSRLKQFGRVATRFEKSARHCLAVVTLASTILWFR